MMYFVIPALLGLTCCHPSTGLIGQSYHPGSGGLPFKRGLLCLSNYYACTLYVNVHHPLSQTLQYLLSLIFVPLLASTEVTVLSERQGKEGRKRAKATGLVSLVMQSVPSFRPSLLY